MSEYRIKKVRSNRFLGADKYYQIQVKRLGLWWNVTSKYGRDILSFKKKGAKKILKELLKNKKGYESL